MTIKEVSEKFSLTADTLRFYEKKGLIGPINKTSGGIRNYDENDLRRIEFIKCMREAELPIAVLKEYVDLFEKGESTVKERKRLLEEQREVLRTKIDNMQKAYERLNNKINLYNEGKLDKYIMATENEK